MMDQRKETAKELGMQFDFLKNIKPTLFIASTDLNHYESEEITRAKDQEVIDAITSTDIDRLYSIIIEQHISMCGFGPVAALLASEVGIPSLLKHATSGEISGDYQRVVGYASFLVR
jgi:AmmeMemoRadiSam system protein B